MAGNESKYLNEVLASGWLTTSSKAMRFEEKFAQYVGAKYACAVNSCTSALHLAIEALRIKHGDRVLVPSMTFIASAEIIRYMGGDPIFMDVEYGTRLISPALLKDALNKHTDIKALVLVHYGGQSPVMRTEHGEGIIDICNRKSVAVIEDAAHAFPSKFHDQHAGTFGKAGCFSFYATKTITTGEGGMLVTNDESIYERVKVMRLHGINHDIWDRYTNGSSWEYDIIAPGYKYNMPDINAAIGLAQLEKAETFRMERQRCVSYYLNALTDIPVIDLPVYMDPLENHACHLFTIVIKPEACVTRNEFIQQMSAAGIGTSVHYKPLHRMTYYRRKYSLKPEDYPNSEMLWNGIVSLPVYPDLTNKELDFICRTIRQILT